MQSAFLTIISMKTELLSQEYELFQIVQDRSKKQKSNKSELKDWKQLYVY